ncbi:MAG TPA: CheR family methyltransferase [Polyangiales bacterium]|nr:CheR family methyltransferase [Polyangiales bacterium]
MRANAFVWFRLPKPVLDLPPVQTYGVFLQRLVRMRSRREQNPRTYFLRNRPELEVICQLAIKRPQNSTYKVAVLACSMGAEAYTILSGIKKIRPDLQVEMQGLDISPEPLAIAKEGLWDRDAFQLERLTPSEIDEFFDREGSKLRVKEWLRKGVKFQLADATQPSVIASLGQQDLVIANRFLCHMQPMTAETALRNIATLVAPQGHLVCSGVDVDVRTKVMASLGWKPVLDRMEEIHEGDHTLRDGWPWEYWALEPLDKKRPDWQLRYATVFQKP